MVTFLKEWSKKWIYNVAMNSTLTPLALRGATNYIYPQTNSLGDKMFPGVLTAFLLKLPEFLPWLLAVIGVGQVEQGLSMRNLGYDGS